MFNVATADDVRGENCKVREAKIMNKIKAVIMLFRVGGRTAVEEFIAGEILCDDTKVGKEATILRST